MMGMLVKSLWLAVFFLVTAVCADVDDKSFGEATVAEVTSIYDGDTFRCNLKDMPPIIGERISVRIMGIDTPEMTDKRPQVKALAQSAKQHTVQRLRDAKHITLRNMRRDKYFRVLAEVWVDGQNLGDELIAKGFAHEYDGGTKAQW
jgi:endonuclease YncB( thermonuclease family)